MKSLVAIIFLVGVSLSTVRGQDRTERLNKNITALLECAKVPGFTMSVVLKGELVLHSVYGDADKVGKKKVTGNTMFGIGSVTKSFTAALLAKLLPKTTQKYNFTTRVKDILGEVFDDDLLDDHATIRDLLNHQTGYPRYDPVVFKGGMGKDNLIKKIKYMKRYYGFRFRPMYNNFMYLLAGRIAVKLAGDKVTYEDLLTREILKPLGMTKTTFFGKPLPTGMTMSKSYTPNAQAEEIDPNGCQKPIKDIAPAGGIISTALDMSKYLKMLLNFGKLPDGTQLIDANQVQMQLFWPHGIFPFSGGEYSWGELRWMYNPHTRKNVLLPRGTRVLIDTIDNYGFGFWLGYHRGFKQAMHTGDIPGFSSRMSLIPDVKLGIFTVLNGMDGAKGKDVNNLVHSLVRNTIFGSWSNINLACPATMNASSSTVEKREVSSFATKDLDKYTGTFTNDLYDDLIVNRTDSKADLRMYLGNLGKFRLIQTTTGVNSTNAFQMRRESKDWCNLDETVVTFDNDKDALTVPIDIGILPKRLIGFRFKRTSDASLVVSTRFNFVIMLLSAMIVSF